jgi:hypothetical protein
MLAQEKTSFRLPSKAHIVRFSDDAARQWRLYFEHTLLRQALAIWRWDSRVQNSLEPFLLCIDRRGTRPPKEQEMV